MILRALHPAARLTVCMLAGAGSASSAHAQNLSGPTAEGLFRDLPAVAYFPPTVPVYGARIPARAAPEGMVFYGLRPPEGLAPYVNEWFYPPLGTWLAGEALTKKLQQRLDAYLTKRLQLLSALDDQLTLVHDADAATREHTLRAFAEVQRPALRALEQEAEELRADLANGRLFDSANWNNRRRWKIGETTFGREADEKEAEFQVIRAAAYYEPGLLPQQRGLLRELAMDLQLQARAARTVTAPLRTDAAAMFFSPEMSRFELPPKLPAEALARLARYNGEKAALKRELREALIAHDAHSPARRTRALTDLAALHWPRFEALEKLAEEIRVDLAALPERGPPPAPPSIPQALIKEIESFNADRQAYFNEREAAGREAANRVPPVPRDTPADERIQRQRQVTAERLEAQRKAMQEFHRETQERYAALQKRFETIRTLLTAVAEAQKDPTTGKPHTADSLIKHYASANERFDVWGREEVIYKNYRVAMLQPGLSPEQRRLLFGAVLVGLALPLPDGTPMPNTRHTRPLPSS